MEMVITIEVEKLNDKYILRLDSWQLEEIKTALTRINKQRAAANKWVEKTKDRKVTSRKPKLVIGDVVVSSPPKTP